MLVVNIDLVIPAIIKDELKMYKALAKKENGNLYKYSQCFTISPKHIMAFAMWLKTLHFGRVIVNFTEEDALKYLRRNSNVFKEFDGSRIFIIDFLECTEKNIQKYIDKLTLDINYDLDVLEFLEIA